MNNIDRPFFATGYTSFLFFDDYLNIIDDRVSLYHFVSSLLLEQLTLAFIGLIQWNPVVIQQNPSRWVGCVRKGMRMLLNEFSWLLCCCWVPCTRVVLQSSQVKLKDWTIAVSVAIHSFLSFRISPSSSQILFRLNVIIRSDFFFLFWEFRKKKKSGRIYL